MSQEGNMGINELAEEFHKEVADTKDWHIRFYTGEMGYPALPNIIFNREICDYLIAYFYDDRIVAYHTWENISLKTHVTLEYADPKCTPMNLLGIARVARRICRIRNRKHARNNRIGDNNGRTTKL